MLAQLTEKKDISYQTELNALDAYSINELINYSIEKDSTQNHLFRQELIERGKDNIKQRIEIKKVCKLNIAHQEDILKDLEGKKSNNKDLLSFLRNKFLTAISLLDRLQLEWQKHDIRLKR